MSPKQTTPASSLISDFLSSESLQCNAKPTWRCEWVDVELKTTKTSSEPSLFYSPCSFPLKVSSLEMTVTSEMVGNNLKDDGKLPQRWWEVTSESATYDARSVFPSSDLLNPKQLYWPQGCARFCFTPTCWKISFLSTVTPPFPPHTCRKSPFSWLLLLW